MRDHEGRNRGGGISSGSDVVDVSVQNNESEAASDAPLTSLDSDAARGSCDPPGEAKRPSFQPGREKGMELG